MRTIHYLLLPLAGSALHGLATQVVFNNAQGLDQHDFNKIDWEYHRWIAPAVYNNPSDPVLNLALKLALLTTDAPDSFTLDDIKLHGTIEHDASLSRSDINLGDNHHFNATVFLTLSESFTPGSTPDSDVYDPISVGKAIEKRLAWRRRITPNWFVQIFFREERLPLAEGWTKPPYPTNSTSLMNIMSQLEKASQSESLWLPHPLVACPWTRLQPEGPESVWPPKLPF
ncbi:hypothetical protein GYMLUDRAFT_256383 [Collybiopsis luxurians FD-317 M1]|nr:hypothetical protein GYMLUDRAFT_256383 [Collybiopsis luxurians FD-317 M1]